MSYLTFRTNTAITMRFDRIASGATFEYSYDTINWLSVIKNTDILIQSVLYLRGIGNEDISRLLHYSIQNDTSQHSWSGNMEALVDYTIVDTGNSPTLGTSCFYGFCQYDIGLVNADGLEFPTETLRDSCYAYMFRGCSNLMSAIFELPSKTLAYGCYDSMFMDCTKLTKGPSVLPAITLAGRCYAHMFQGTSVTESCTMLAETLAYQCCIEMYMNCSKLVVAKVPAVTVIEDTEVYRSMFEGCTSLIITPNLPATIIRSTGTGSSGKGAYRSMFKSCTSLTTITNLPATSIWNESYYDMFYGCTSLINVPDDLAATSRSTYSLYRMFYGCTSLKKGPNISGYYVQNYDCVSMFRNCTSLIKAPKINVTSVSSYGCDHMFCGCTSLVTPPDLPATVLATYAYRSMFEGCTSLKSLPKIWPTDRVSAYCYYNMFYGCTSLKTLPELTDLTLADSCYYRMFYGCTGIKLSETKTDEYNIPYRIPSGEGTGTTAKGALNGMFVNTGGTFTGTPTINTTYYLAGEASKPLYVGVNGKAREVTDMYVGVNGKAQEVTAIYVGVNGKARKVFPIDPSSYATVTIKGGKEDEIKIFDGVTLLKTVTFETDKISKKVKLPTNKLLTFTSTKFKYGDDSTYFSKNATIVEDCTIKVMPEGAIYWYGNECEDLTGGWEIHNVEHHTYHGTSSGFSTLTAPLEKNKNSIYAGWSSNDLSQVPTTYYYMSSVATKNAVNYQHSTVKIHIKNSNAVKEITNSQYGVLLGCGYSTTNSGAVYWNIGFGSGNAIDYPNNNAGSNKKSNFYLSGSDSSTNVYFSALLSVYANGSNSRQYGNIEFDYFVLE